jgi:leucyl/phenylalanyl-tRNA---protein transferase
MTRHLPLTPRVLLSAYRMAVFPMADSRTGEISWYSPDPRAIIPLDTFSVPRSVRRLVKQGVFETRINTAFVDVMSACADREETWISRSIIDAYVALHRLGHAHSVEVWSEGMLAGGLYGVAIGGAFFGESMFSRKTGASKVALVSLVTHLREKRFELLDTQYTNSLLEQFGTIEIPRDDYCARLARAITVETTF